MKTRRQDPVKSAIYNPKEFRRSHTVGCLDVGPALTLRHLAVIILAAVLVLSLYLWHTSGGRVSLGTATLPPTGALEILHREPPGAAQAPLKVIGSKYGEHCLLRLAILRTNAPALTVFVRSGEIAEIRVPVGQYRGTIACGSTWYGDRLFGPNVAIEEIELPIAFTYSQSGQIHGMQIEMTKRAGGNLRTRPVLRY